MGTGRDWAMAFGIAVMAFACILLFLVVETPSALAFALAGLVAVLVGVAPFLLAREQDPSLAGLRTGVAAATLALVPGLPVLVYGARDGDGFLPVLILGILLFLVGLGCVGGLLAALARNRRTNALPAYVLAAAALAVGPVGTYASGWTLAWYGTSAAFALGAVLSYVASRPPRKPVAEATS